MMKKCKVAPIGGIGPGGSAGVKANVIKRDSDLSKDLARLRAAESQLLKLGWTYKNGKWV